MIPSSCASGIGEITEVNAGFHAQGDGNPRWPGEDAVNDLAKAVQRDAPANATVHTEEGVFVNGTAPLLPD
jgi:hypothetical protein